MARSYKVRVTLQFGLDQKQVVQTVREVRALTSMPLKEAKTIADCLWENLSSFDLIVTDTLLMFFCIVLTWQSAAWFWEAVSQGLTSGTIWDPPIWPMRLVILVGAFFLLLAAFSKSVRDFLLVVKKDRAFQTE
jgi:hypothetical protein